MSKLNGGGTYPKNGTDIILREKRVSCSVEWEREREPTHTNEPQKRLRYINEMKP